MIANGYQDVIKRKVYMKDFEIDRESFTVFVGVYVDDCVIVWR